MLEKLQPTRIAKFSYWLNAFLTKSMSRLTENVNIIDSDLISADIKKNRFSIFRKSVLLKY